jgi:integrase
VSTHDVRHFSASALIAGGGSVKHVQAVLGHQGAVVTLRIYVHLWPGDEGRTRSVRTALWTSCGLRAENQAQSQFRVAK